jgi:hypothetical protein
VALNVKDILVITVSASSMTQAQNGRISQYSFWRRAAPKVLNSLLDQKVLFLRSHIYQGLTMQQYCGAISWGESRRGVMLAIYFLAESRLRISRPKLQFLLRYRSVVLIYKEGKLLPFRI